MGAALHLELKATERLRFQADGHAFWRPEVGENPFTSAKVDRYVGSEVDLGASFELAQGLDLRTTYSVFVPNGSRDGSTVYYTSHTAHCFELQLRFTLPE